MSKPELYIGLMSGTSVDSIDSALVSFLGEQQTLISFYSHPIPADIKTSLLHLNQSKNIDLGRLCQLERQLGELFAETVNSHLKRDDIPKDKITAIGSHGQTIFHAPEIGMSLQIGHPAVIAKHTGITVAADFRIDDMALNGQGAPFAPVYHQALFTEADKTSFAVNIGGISNISILTHNSAPHGFDSGPGNAILDEISQTYFQCGYDKDGEIALSGNINTALLEVALSDNYFSLAAPKSTGRDYFNLDWLQSLTTTDIPPADLMATATEITAQCIANAIKSFLQNAEKHPVWICGGGAFNPYLIKRIQHRLPNCDVQSSSTKKVNPDAIEAMLFAWLAQQRIHNRTVNLSASTGATRNAVLGGIWHP